MQLILKQNISVYSSPRGYSKEESKVILMKDVRKQPFQHIKRSQKHIAGGICVAKRIHSFKEISDKTKSKLKTSSFTQS